MDRLEAAKVTANLLGLQHWVVNYGTHSAVLFRDATGSIQEWEPWHCNRQAYDLIEAFVSKLWFNDGMWHAEAGEASASDKLLRLAVTKAVYLHGKTKVLPQKTQKIHDR